MSLGSLASARSLKGFLFEVLGGLAPSRCLEDLLLHGLVRERGEASLPRTVQEQVFKEPRKARLPRNVREQLFQGTFGSKSSKEREGRQLLPGRGGGQLNVETVYVAPCLTYLRAPLTLAFAQVNGCLGV